MLDYDRKNSKQFLHKATNFYLEETNKSVKFVNKHDTTIWHLGIGKLFFKTLITYHEKVVDIGVNSLTNMQARDRFERYIQD